MLALAFSLMLPQSAEATTLPALDATEGLFDILEEQEVVISATRRAQSTREVPISTSVITADDIHRAGVSSLPELLRRYAGLDVAQTTANDFTIGIRGFLGAAGSDKVLLLIDGQSMTFDAVGSTYWNQLIVPIEIIDRIEIVRGPATAMYGTNAFSGTVNIVTKSAEKLHAIEATLRPGLGSPGDVFVGDASFVHAAGSGRHHYRLATRVAKPQRISATGTGLLLNAAFAGDYRFDIDEAKTFQVSFYSGGASKRISLGPYRDPSTEANGDQALSFKYQDRAVLGGELRVVLANRTYFIFEREHALDNGAVRAESFSQSLTPNAEINYVRELPGRQTLVLGGDVRATWSNLDVFRQDAVGLTSSVFVTDEWRATDTLTLSGAVRAFIASYIAPQRQAIVNAAPRIGAVLAVAEGHTLRLSLGRALRPPFLLDLFAHGPIYLDGDPGLRSEDTWQVDVGYSARFGKTFEGSLNLFGTRLNDVRIIAGAPGALTTVNLPAFYGMGGEVDFKLTPLPTLRFVANYSLQRYFDAFAHDGQIGSPMHKANLVVDWDPAPGLQLQVAGGFVDKFTVAFGTPIQAQTVDARFFIDARVAYAFAFGLELSVTGSGLNRLLAPAVEYARGQPIPGRVLFGVGYSLGSTNFAW